MSNRTITHSEWDRLSYLLPLIIPGLVIATFIIFYKRFLFCTAANPTCSPLGSDLIFANVASGDEARVATYVAKASWTLVNGVHVLACLAAVLTASIIIYHALSEYSKQRRWALILIVVVSAADVSLMVSMWTNMDVFSPAQQILRATVAQALPSINKYNRLFDALSLTATLSLACAACSTLWQRDVDKEQNETELALRISLLRYVLYVGATLLAIGVLRLSVTLGWGASYLPPDSGAGKAVAVLVAGIVQSLGAYYTLLMGAVYLPAALLLRARARNLAASQPPEERESWLTNRGLALSYAQSLPRVIALLSPLLAGPFGELLIRLTGAISG